MCDGHDSSYNENFPAFTFGGPTGDYEITSPIPSGRWAEYTVVAIANGDGGAASVFISGNSQPPKQLVYDGSKTLTKDTYVTGMAARVAQTTTSYPATGLWDRITHSQQKVFARIDAANSTSVYITLKFREKLITVVPGPSHTVHPDHQHQMNIAREEKTKERLSKLGIPAYAQEGA